VAVGGEGVHPAPQMFTTFTTFTTFAKFAKFAKFANFDPAWEHPTALHRHAPRPESISERASTTPSPCAQGEGWGEGFLRGRGVRASVEVRPPPPHLLARDAARRAPLVKRERRLHKRQVRERLRKVAE
jgi:hypothetical protein